MVSKVSGMNETCHHATRRPPGFAPPGMIFGFLGGFFLFAGSAFGQIFTENAGVTSPETPTFREYFSFLEAENVTDLRFNHQLLLGLDPRTELRFTVPTVLSRDVSFGGIEGGTSSKDMAGLGDLSLRLKYSLYQTDSVMASARWAVLGELEAPTGRDDRRVDDVRIPRLLQLGTGGWGYGVGTAYTVIRDRHRFSTDIFFRHRTRHEGFRRGESVHWDLAYWYRLTPAQHDPENETIEIRGVFEILSSYGFESRLGSGGAGDEGLLIWVAPGIQIYPRRDVLIEAAIRIPALQTLDDALGDRRWAFLISVKLLF